VSRLRARCPDCRTLTAVALGAEYECHACGRCFPAGLVRVPRAWGTDGEAMAEAANLALPYPEASVVDERTLAGQNLALAADLPALPVVLGGCCCAHVGAIAGLAARYDRLGLVWLDAHGDLNTPATSPSGNLWGMPFRMVLDAGTVAVEDAVLIGARDLDPPERAFIEEAGLALGEEGLARALDGVDAVYVALDVDVLDPAEPLVSHMPTAGGPTIAETAALLVRMAGAKPVAGVGITGLAPAEGNAAALRPLLAALGL
jgi:arginase